MTDGRLVAVGPLNELRRGISIADGDNGAHSELMSLEDYFIRVIGGARPADDDMLAWLG